MSDLISRDEAILNINREFLNYSQMISKKTVLRALRETPAIECTPVKRSQWKDWGSYICGKFTVTDMECPLCGFKTYKADYNYCPQCGADMRERRDNE